MVTMVTAAYMPSGYFDWMSDDNDQLTSDRLNLILRHMHGASDQDDEVMSFSDMLFSLPCTSRTQLLLVVK